jgi:hypothetical protein
MIDFSIFDQFDEVTITPPNAYDMCCESEMFINEIEGLFICCLCGSCKTYSITVVEEANCTITYKSIYRPVKHWAHKLNKIMGHLIPDKRINWRPLFNGANINTIYDVRKVLKKKHKSKLNKFSYHFFQQLTGLRVWTLQSHEIDSLKRAFLKIHMTFRRERASYCRKNLPSYHFILMKLLNSQGHKTKNKLFTPRLAISIQKNEQLWNDLF